ncbi:hypothetical protein [Rhodoplanes sp. SY1]|uniref:P-type ATPase n=1 Tax=Rhodoplanes sp. SY1 TaxID=3166646 RepID=UPI0038B585AE
MDDRAHVSVVTIPRTAGEIASAVIAMPVDPAGGVEYGLVILAVVIINSTIGFAQEYKASKAIESIGAMVPEFATVQRDGRRVQVPAVELVVGDVVFLQSGYKVPADKRLLDLRALHIEEATLTGESVPVEKVTELMAENAGRGDHRNMAFRGSPVTYGAGLGAVTATGNGAELGRIAPMLDETTAMEAPLSIALHKIGIVLTGADRLGGADRGRPQRKVRRGEPSGWARGLKHRGYDEREASNVGSYRKGWWRRSS